MEHPVKLSSIQQRRANLQLIVRVRFQENQTAAARAAGVHPNHFNCLVSDNVKATRNLGEVLARKIEAGLGLEPGWLDTPHETVDEPAKRQTVIPAKPMPVELATVLRTADCEGVILTQAWIDKLALHVATVDHLSLAAVTTNELAEHGLPVDSHVIVETTGHFLPIKKNGVYVMVRKPTKGKEPKSPHDFSLRSFQHDPVTDVWIVHGKGTKMERTHAQMEDLWYVARIIAVAPLPTML